jgi:hypothetical protein
MATPLMKPLPYFGQPMGAGAMQPRQDVPSFDLTRGFGPSPSLVTGARRPSVNTNGRMGMPKLDAAGERIGSRGYSTQRLAEMARRRLGSAMRGGDMQAAAMLFRGPMGRGGYGSRPPGEPPQAAPQRPVLMGQQPPIREIPEIPESPDPLANLEPPATTAQALGWPLEEPPQRPAGQPTSSPMMPARMPWEGQPLPGFSPMGFMLPPSTLDGGTGLPPPPVYDNKNPLPLIPSPQEVRAFGLQPDYSKPQTYNGKQFPTFTKPPAAESQRWQLYDAPGPMVPHPYLKDLMIPGPPIKRQVDPITGETRDLVEEGTARGAKPAGQAAPAPDAQAPGWLDWLKGKTAGKTAAAEPTVTGQMPNVAYSNDQPALSLDAARDEYSRTGDDSLLRQYFAENPRPVPRPYGQYPNIAVPQRPATPAMPVMQAPPRPGTAVPQAVKNPQGLSARMQRAGPGIERATSLATAAPGAAASLMALPLRGSADAFQRWLQERAQRNPQGIMAGINDLVK